MSLRRKTIDLRESFNPHCQKDCSTETRKELTFEGICEIVPSTLDGMPVRCVGDWAFEKIYYLTRYFDIFASGMHNKWANKLNYIEICCGPGRCVQKNDGKEIDGTALSIINHDSFSLLKEAVFIDQNENHVASLRKRITNLGKDNIARAIVGDYTDKNLIKTVFKKMPMDCLNLLFVDPTDCSVPFSTIEKFSAYLERVDLILNIATGTDLKRNIRNAILLNGFERAKKKYIEFLGNEEFFNDPNCQELARLGSEQELLDRYIGSFKNNLEKIGYKFFDAISIRQYYQLFFATKHERGLEFWKKVQRIDHSGQRSLFSL